YASRARGIQNKSRITIDSSTSSAEIIPLLQEISTLKSQLAQLTLSHQSNVAEIHSAFHTEISAAHTDISGRNETIRILQENIESLVAEVATYRHDAEDKHRLIEVLSSELKELQNMDMKHDDITVLKTQIYDLNTAIDLEFEVEKRKSIVEDNSVQILTKNVSALTNELNEFKAKFKNLQVENESLKTEKMRILCHEGSKQTDLQLQTFIPEKMVPDVNVELVILRSENEQLKASIESMQKKLQQRQKMMSSMDLSLRSRLQDIRRLKSELANTASENTALKVPNHQRQIQQEKSINGTVETQINGKQKSGEKFKACFDEMKLRLKGFEEQKKTWSSGGEREKEDNDDNILTMRYQYLLKTVRTVKSLSFASRNLHIPTERLQFDENNLETLFSKILSQTK
ncbi:hypothetical protein HK100_012711, partial [Physocladia obscura]